MYWSTEKINGRAVVTLALPIFNQLKSLFNGNIRCFSSEKRSRF